MGEISRWVIKLALKAGAFTTVIIFWLVLIGALIKQIYEPVNSSVLGDLSALLQLWTPFNINTVVAWLLTAVNAYLTYKIVIIIYNLVDSYLD